MNDYVTIAAVTFASTISMINIEIQIILYGFVTPHNIVALKTIFCF